jgi:glycosyltransferase involved in cell wall biosynthesis
MSAEPLISVVVLNHNNGPFIGETIQSVVLQAYREWEMIIIENASTDDSWEIIQAWMKREPRIQAVRLSRAVSIPAGRNLGLVRARGIYIAPLDSDDAWLPELLCREVEFMERGENAEIGVCGANSILIDSEGTEIGRKDFPQTDAECRRAFWYRNPFCHCAVLVRRTCFDQFGVYDESFALAEDLELWMRLGQAFRLRNLPEHLARIRVSGRNVTRRKHRELIRQTLCARRLARARYGYSINLSGRIALVLTWCAQWLASSVVHRLFQEILLRRFAWLWTSTMPPEQSLETPLRVGPGASPPTDAATGASLAIEPNPSTMAHLK